MRLQLWSWNYAPEWTAMGPMATLWAREMVARGHEVEVVTAHPHYPPNVWPQSVRPYRETRDGITILRLPLWIGHGTSLQRAREELTYAGAVAASAPLLRSPDVVVAVSPSFLALAPTLMSARMRRRPYVLWLQDIFPDAATTTGLVTNGIAIRAARWLESAAYRSAARIVVIADSFSENLMRKGVPRERITRIYNPATHDFNDVGGKAEPPVRLLCMGNIGYSQGLVEFVRAFETADGSRLAKLVIAGSGELANEVRNAITSDRVEYLGLLNRNDIEEELRRTACGVVSQRADIEEFNLPSKLMNLMAKGLPVWANVAPDSEVARIVTRSGGGWISTSGDPISVDEVLGQIVDNSDELLTRGRRALQYAQTHFHPSRFADRFEEVLVEVATASRE